MAGIFNRNVLYQWLVRRRIDWPQNTTIWVGLCRARPTFPVTVGAPSNVNYRGFIGPEDITHILLDPQFIPDLPTCHAPCQICFLRLNLSHLYIAQLIDPNYAS